MIRLRRETKRFKQQAINSLVLAIELFNQPHNISRTEVVLIFLQHAFEMLIKAAIYEKRGTVFEQGSSITYSFDRCLTIARSDLKILTEDTATTLSIVDGCRDCAMHYLLDMSEGNLYLFAQASVTIFNDILQKAFGERLANYLPERVLPVSTNPPQEINLLVDKEFSQIRELLTPGKRRQAEVKAKIRPYFIMESALAGNIKQPSDGHVAKVIKRMKRGENWCSIFPGVACLQLDTTGHGLTYSVRFTRQSSAPPVRILREGESAKDATLVREVNLFDRYTMGLHDLADKVGLGRTKTLALVHHLGLQADPECFKEFRHKSLHFRGYSPKALQRIQEALPNIDIDHIVQEFFRQRGQKTGT